MTLCPRTGHQCHCQPDEGMPCPYGANSTTNPKLNFEQRQQAQRMAENGDQLDQCFELVWARAEIERLRGERDTYKAQAAAHWRAVEDLQRMVTSSAPEPSAPQLQVDRARGCVLVSGKEYITGDDLWDALWFSEPIPPSLDDGKLPAVKSISEGPNRGGIPLDSHPPTCGLWDLRKPPICTCSTLKSTAECGVTHPLGECLKCY